MEDVNLCVCVCYVWQTWDSIYRNAAFTPSLLYAHACAHTHTYTNHAFDVRSEAAMMQVDQVRRKVERGGNREKRKMVSVKTRLLFQQPLDPALIIILFLLISLSPCFCLCRHTVRIHSYTDRSDTACVGWLQWETKAATTRWQDVLRLMFQQNILLSVKQVLMVTTKRPLPPSHISPCYCKSLLPDL